MSAPIYPYPSPSAQLEQLAGAAEQASPPSNEYGSPMRPPNPRKRKADGTPAAARGVANLTPDQLAKKRANDREAQRAIRERTKNNIQALQRRIKELENQQPFKEMQSVLRSKDAIIAENEDLKRRLASISALSQYQAPPGHDLNDLARATAQQRPLPTSSTSQSSREQMQLPATPDNEGAQQHLHPDLRHLAGGSIPTAPMQASTTDRVARSKAGKPDALPLPLHSASENALDSGIEAAINGLLAARRELYQPHELVFPTYTTLADSHRPSSLSFTTLSSGVASIVNALLLPGSTTPTAERIAVMYIMYYLLQYLLAPSPDTFERLPQWLRPTEAQTEKEHGIWIDVLPWPTIRDRAILGSEPYPESFISDAFANLSLNWSYPTDLCTMQAPGTGQGSEATASTPDSVQHVLNPVFEAHIRDLDNWTLDGDVAQQQGSDDTLAMTDGQDASASADQHDDAGLEGLLQELNGETSR